MKKIVGFLLISLGSLSLLPSCGLKEPNKKVALSYGALFDETAEANMHFALSIRANGDKQETTYLTPYSTLKTLVDRKESFILVNVPSFTCLCYAEFRNNCLLPYMKEHNLRIYLMRQSDLEGVDVANRFGIQGASDPLVCLFSKGEIIAQKEAKTGEGFHDSYQTFRKWMDERISSFPQFLAVNDSQLDSLYGGANDFLIYYARFSCSDCTYFQTNFLTDYLEKRANPMVSCYFIDCDQEGIRYRDGEFSQSQWDAYRLSHGLAADEDNPAGYGDGFVPTLFHICPNGETKTGDVILAADVFFNDEYEKQEDGHCKITASYFSEERLSSPELGYLKESQVQTKVLEGMDLGIYEGDGDAPYSWYQKKMAPYHEAIAEAFLGDF